MKDTRRRITYQLAATTARGTRTHVGHAILTGQIDQHTTKAAIVQHHYGNTPTVIHQLTITPAA